MTILFYCHVPFMLAHGGAQIQIEQTMAGLKANNVDAEPLRWWDETQTGNIVHHFGRIPTSLIRFAQQKNMKVVVADLLTEQGSRSRSRLRAQRIVMRLMRRTLPGSITGIFNWDSYRLADACIANTNWEGHLMTYLFEAPKERIHVVPNGVEGVFLDSPPATRGPWLVCAATITERKRVLELAAAAVAAQTPIWVVGKPYSEADPYYQKFLSLADRHPQLIRYEGAVQDRVRLAQIYREARGFVLLSTMETLSLSADEAAACECPLLLSDLPWAKSHFGGAVAYCPITSSIARTSQVLRKFYDEAPGLGRPPKPKTWAAIGKQLQNIYEGLLRTSA